MISKWRKIVVIVLLLLGAGISGLLLFQHHGEGEAVAAVNQLCGEAQETGCNEVNQSVYSEVAGVPLAGLGIVFYSSMAILLLLALTAPAPAALAASWIVLLFLALALLVDLLLFALQAFAIGSFCKLCIATYALGGVSFALIWPVRKQKFPRKAMLETSGRLLMAGWLFSLLGLVAAVGAGEAALDLRETERALSILGDPGELLGSSTASSDGQAALESSDPFANLISSPVSTGGNEDLARQVETYKQQAVAARRQADELKKILDDPTKVNEYYVKKSMQEFEASDRLQFDLDGVPSKGASNAPVKIVEFFDYLCSHCRDLHKSMRFYLPMIKDRIQIFYKNYPLDPACNPNVKRRKSSGSCMLALGGICAAEQDRFSNYQDKVFAGLGRMPDVNSVTDIATQLGMDSSSFKKCMNSSQTLARLQAQIREGHDGGVSGTPTLFLNGRKLPHFKMWSKTANKELQRLGYPPLTTGH